MWETLSAVPEVTSLIHVSVWWGGVVTRRRPFVQIAVADRLGDDPGGGDRGRREEKREVKEQRGRSQRRSCDWDTSRGTRGALWIEEIVYLNAWQYILRFKTWRIHDQLWKDEITRESSSDAFWTETVQRYYGEPEFTEELEGLARLSAALLLCRVMYFYIWRLESRSIKSVIGCWFK